MEFIVAVIIVLIAHKYVKRSVDKENKEIDENPDAPGHKSFMGSLW